MTYKQEVQRLVLNHLLDKYSPGTPLNDEHYTVAYNNIRAEQILDTLIWKLEHLAISL